MDVLLTEAPASAVAEWLDDIAPGMSRAEQSLGALVLALDNGPPLNTPDAVAPMLALRQDFGVGGVRGDHEACAAAGKVYADRLRAAADRIERGITALLWRTDANLAMLAASHPDLLRVTPELRGMLVPLSSGAWALCPEEMPEGHADRERLCEVMAPADRLQVQGRGGPRGVLVLSMRDVPEWVALGAVRTLTDELRVVQLSRESAARDRAPGRTRAATV